MFLGKKLSKNQLNIVEVFKQSFDTAFGEATEEAGKIAFASLKAATKALKEDQIDVLVTAPINKKNIQSEDFNFPGHTDYLAKALEGESLMFMVSDSLKSRFAHRSHPCKRSYFGNNPRFNQAESSKNESLFNRRLWYPQTKIALLGINPHIGDNGVIGEEDDKVLRPTQQEIYADGTLLFGPYAADSFFGTELPNSLMPF